MDMPAKATYSAIFFMFLVMIAATACDLPRGQMQDDVSPLRSRGELQKIVDEWRTQQRIPGVVVGISIPRRAEILIASGMASLEDRIPIQANDQFRIASITKTFIAAEVLNLAAQGKIKLDDPLNVYLPDIPYGNVVTVRQLLSHRSGYFDPIHDDPEFIPLIAEHLDKQWTWAEMLSLAFQHELFFEPGSDYRYSNTNYMLLGLIIEKISARLLGEALTSDLIAPLGLANTFYTTPKTDANQPGLARGYITHPVTGEIVDSTSIPYETILSTSVDTMISNATDLLKWSRSLYGEESLVLEQAFQQEMLTFDSMSPYGLGVFQSNTPIGKAVGHGGETAGYLSLMEYIPDQDVAIVILINADAPHINISELRNSLLAAMFPDLSDAHVEALLADLQSEDIMTRKSAIVALGHSKTSSPEVISGLSDVLALDQSAENRREAALALGLVGGNSENARQALTSALQDGDATVREAAQLALSLIQ